MNAAKAHCVQSLLCAPSSVVIILARLKLKQSKKQTFYIRESLALLQLSKLACACASVSLKKLISIVVYTAVTRQERPVVCFRLSLIAIKLIQPVLALKCENAQDEGSKCNIACWSIFSLSSQSEKKQKFLSPHYIALSNNIKT